MTAAVGPAARGRRGSLLPRSSLVGFALALTAVVLVALASYRSLVNNAEAATKLAETLEVLEQLEAVLSTLKDAETGQRGFLLTGDESYLDPYVDARAALIGEFRNVRSLTADNAQRQRQLDAIETLATDKLNVLAEAIEVRRRGDAAGALAIVRSGRGKAVMDSIRSRVLELKNDERLTVASRQTALRDAAQWSYITTGGGLAMLLVLIVIAAMLAAREHRAQRTESWLRAGLAEFRVRLQGDQRLDVLGRNALDFLCAYLGAPVGALYIRQSVRQGPRQGPADPEAGGWRRFASHALPEAGEAPVLRAGDGLLGQALQENRALHVRDVPAGYLPVSSALGSAEPTELLIAPAAVDGVVFAAVELGFFGAVDAADRELLARVSESLGIAVRSAQDRSQLEDLLEETQRQAEELQTQQEELRVNNEELEEQSRALKESQARMETQQAELEQINSQLEEQAQLLEHQKDELAASQAVLTDKAAELVRSNQYKSEFLANMSHELRTPLNSTLILAKLLADNTAGNLSAEQVKYAQTISSAGNDLLALINDILDLSKIEAGKIDVMSERVAIAATVDALRATFEPLVRQKGLAFETAIDAGTPAQIETDGQRLGQILKNLVSNAAKFTERGHVAVRVFAPQPGHVAFAVRDTGIGIAPAQHETVFEAFRQADGSTHRKFGGTGLGLSISRDLARLLGGDIAIESAPGEGSLFTLTLPVKPAVQDAGSLPHEAPPTAARAAVAAPVGWGSAGSAPAPLAPAPLEDDRDHWVPNARSLLVIEDDLRFAAILRDLAREMGFLCVLAHTANDGLAAARALRPSAILLDMRLPDHSGLGVLDQLKRDPLTRHIPVHVASVEDHRHEAFERGAVGYAIKPVQRQELVEALQRLEAKFTAGLKRVLVVEDDARQRDSIRLLLAHGEVQITDADTAAEALAQLQTTTFDCMVMDLNLPDLSGYELLERMAQQHDVAFPPVIVYTGRSLTRDEEQQLRRHSKSIIVKDARSPERLLDEVTLFLHQVESVLPAESQRLLKAARARDTALEGRRILIVEDDVRNIFALSSVLESKGAQIAIARNGREALDALDRAAVSKGSAGTALAPAIDMVLMDIMMPEMDGFTAMREIRQRPEWKKLPIIALTAKAMRNDQEECLAAGANDYIAKPLDVEKLLSLIRVWMPK